MGALAILWKDGPWIIAAVCLIGLGVAGYLLKGQYEANGALKGSNTQLSTALAAKSAAVRDRAQVNQAVRKMAPAEKLEKLK